eukprot:gene4838-34594_t
MGVVMLPAVEDEMIRQRLLDEPDNNFGQNEQERQRKMKALAEAKAEEEKVLVEEEATSTKQ